MSNRVMLPRRTKIEIFRSKKNKQYYFRVLGLNGQIIAQSEGYTRRANCRHSIKKLEDAMIRHVDIIVLD